MTLAECSTFGTRLRYYRLKRQWSAADLGEMVGLARNTISGIEHDVHYPSAPRIQRLAQALGIEAGELFPKGWRPRAQKKRVASVK